jgi:hypothetical protein
MKSGARADARKAGRVTLIGALLLSVLAGCPGHIVGTPPNLSADPCNACMQNCRLKTGVCDTSSASDEACRTRSTDCLYRCRKSYCPREAPPPEDREERENRDPVTPID